MFFEFQKFYDTSVFKNNFSFNTSWTGSNLQYLLPHMWKELNPKPEKSKFLIEPNVLLSFVPGLKINGDKVLKTFFGFRVDKADFKIVELPFIDSPYGILLDFLSNSFRKSNNLGTAFRLPTLWKFINFFRFKLTVIINDNNSGDCVQVFDLNQNSLTNVDKKIETQFYNYAPVFNLKKQILLPVKCFFPAKRNNIKFIINSLKSAHHDLLSESQSIFEISFDYPTNNFIPMNLDLTKQSYEIFNYNTFLFTNRTNNPTTIETIDYEHLKFESNLLNTYENSQKFYRLWRYHFIPINLSKLTLESVLKHFDYEVIYSMWEKIINWYRSKEFANNKILVEDSEHQIHLSMKTENTDESITNKLMFHYSNDLFFPKSQKIFKSTHYQKFLIKNQWDPETRQFIETNAVNGVFLSNWFEPKKVIKVRSNFKLETFVNFEFLILQKISFENLFLQNLGLTFSKEPWEDAKTETKNWKIELFEETILNIDHRHLTAINQKKLLFLKQYQAFLKIWLIQND